MIFFTSGVLVNVLKALLMSCGVKSVRCVGFCALEPSCMCCVRIVRTVVDKCLALNRVERVREYCRT